ncbi:alpha-L-rhamnosidase C-terminal domain-containing protein [Bacteroidota bacterium]
MSRYIYSIWILLLQMLPSSGQYADHTLPQFPEDWNSNWISHPEVDKAAFGLIHFRNTIELESVPEAFIIHVSGDNRYRLHVNGIEVSYGPQLADMRHWRYETIDIAPYLNEGKNVIAAEVMNWGVDRSYGIISFKTAFLLQGHSKDEELLNTGYNSKWKVYKNEAVFEKPVYWLKGKDIIGGFYAANPTDSIVASDYPWGWKQLSYDDSQWVDPEVVFSQPKTNAGAGHGWILQPRTTPIQKNSVERFTRIGRSNQETIKTDFKFGDRSLELPANTTTSVLVDQGYVTLGYPKLLLSGGKDAYIKITYSEALYDENRHKGNRNEIEGKEIKGISDVYIMDGKKARIFQPLWLRTFRFIQLDIETSNDPLFIEDYFNVYSASPVPLKASFSTDNPLYERIWDICWHGLKICAQDNLLSDAYYEQMQYVGDLRPHLKAWTALTGDYAYFRSAMEQFNNSRLPDGNITSCYPLKATFVHPTYSLIWIDMLHDVMMYFGDESFIRSFLSEIMEVFDYYESIINENELVGKSNYQMFIDWYLPKGGNSEVNKDGNSAILTLNYAYTLKNAAEIYQWLGLPEMARSATNRSLELAKSVRDLCYNEEKGLYADDPEKTFYDQRASILAVLAGFHTDEERKVLMNKILDRNMHFDSYANLFYYFYLFEAMLKTGMGNFSQVLEPWNDIAAMGMTATPEKRIEQHPRSEVHPWTAHPVHYYFSYAAGITPSSPGFQRVKINPHPGDLTKIQAKYPTHNGIIDYDMNFNNDHVKGTIILPEFMEGLFIWRDTEIVLQPGKNAIDIK